MNITSQQTHSYLAQRIAKVRNCMLVELSTGVSPNDKDLFTSLCQAYEQNSGMTSPTASTSSQRTLDQVFSISDLIPESILSQGLAGISGGDTLPRQHKIGFSSITWSHLMDWDDWGDWGKGAY